MKPVIHEIFVHCTATSPEWMDDRSAEEQVAEIDRWHKARGWRGFGYNELCNRKGQAANGRQIGEDTAAVQGHNRHAVHLVLTGGRGAAATDKFDFHFTPPQRAWLIKRLRELREEYPNAKIRGHNEVAAKGCPGFNVAEWLLENPLEKAEPEPAGGLLAEVLSIFRIILGRKA